MTRLKNQIAEASNSGTRLGLDAAERRPGAQDSMILRVPIDCERIASLLLHLQKIIGRLRAALTKL
jgi:hypothetical protein